MSSSDDELARTATAAPTVPAQPASSPIGGSLGRYKLERELGAGGMGVVHAAFDPDLERRVAIKVLRSEHGDEASKRLLREARAMARLTHANVITVHEVGSASGRDFIAMELVDGTTLAEWLRATPRKPVAIIDAFLAAGRGLAAAHAAGIVHRDFKPHNVLCGKSGRIVVTDFGLAREAEPALDPLAVTMPVGAVASTTTGSTSPLSGLTVEGSVLGTPAYMAPEQWAGGTVTPATDQFAYCVALWEALSGERPYKGPTVEDLKIQVARGPHALDASKIPRPLRATLRRGLDPDPAKRWASMDVLLGKIKRAELRPGVAVAIGSVAVAATIAGIMVFHPEDSPAALPCAGPLLSAETVAGKLGDLPSAELKPIFEGEVARWTRARDSACTNSDAPTRHAQLQCLDAVMARLDAVRRAALIPPQPVLVDEIALAAVDPALCLRPEPPALAISYSDAAVAGVALRRLDSDDPYDEAADAAAVKVAGNDACARFQLALARGMNPKAARARQSVDEAIVFADQCRDDRAKAEASLLALYYQIGVFSEPKLMELTRRTELAVARVDQTELRARFDELAGKAALVGGNYDVALAKLDAAITGFARMPHNQLEAASDRIGVLVVRNMPADVTRANAEIAKWRPIAQALNEPEITTGLERLSATLAWFAGDVEGAHRRLVALETIAPQEPAGTRRVTGVVVDPSGKPVAGATVVGGAVIVVDSVGIGLPIGPAHILVRTKTDARGSFTLEGLAETATVAAEHDHQRSAGVPIADKVRLVLGPVGKVSGRVDLTGVRPHEVFVVAVSGRPGASPMYQYLAPVAPDGRYTLDGVLRGKVRVGLAIRNSKGESFALRDLAVGAKPLEDVAITPPARRSLSVLVRSTSAAPLDGAIVFVLPGKLGPQNLRDLKTLFDAAQVSMTTANPIGGEPPANVTSKHLRNDLLATFTNAPVGRGMMCAVGLQGDLTDPAFSELVMKALDKLDVRCAPLAADATVGVLEIPPMKRLDPKP